MSIQSELKQNPEFKIKVILLLFWIAKKNINRNNVFLHLYGRLVGCIYSFLAYWIMGVDISYQTEVGRNLKISHGIGIVVNPTCIIGNNVWIRQNTTIGNNLYSHKAPRIGNNVNIGANVCIIGDISIGDNCIIGAGSVVTKSMPSNCVIAGNPARILRTIN